MGGLLLDGKRALQCLPIPGSYAGGHILLGLASQGHCFPLQRPLIALWVSGCLPLWLAAHAVSQTQFTVPQVHSRRPLKITDALAIESHASPVEIRVNHAALPAGTMPLGQRLVEPG